MTKKQLDKLRTFDGSSMLLKALNRKTSAVFDAWIRQNHPGEVFDEKQLETMGDISKKGVLHSSGCQKMCSAILLYPRFSEIR